MKIDLDETSPEFKEIKKEWFARAKKMKMEELPNFIANLMEDYKHDYGTICHAMSAGAIATVYAMNNTEQGGISGFQAGGVMWEFISAWMYSNNKCGLRIVDYDDFLYPQYEYRFEKAINPDTWKNIQEQAQIALQNKETAHPNVISHWENITMGAVPFGYAVKDD